jgi:methylthioribose-1-phosphate isomerase
LKPVSEETASHGGGAAEEEAKSIQVEPGLASPVSALWWDSGTELLEMIDQTKLPAHLTVLRLHTVDQVAEAIRSLQVRGAPAIGVAAAYGMALGAREQLEAADPVIDPEAARLRLRALAASLRSTRPTAVNLAWALARALDVAERHLQSGKSVADLPACILAEAHRISAEDKAACDAMGKIGATLIKDGDILLTHCNAGALATAGIGTALAPIFVAWSAGRRIQVFVDETRPVLQGARLTAWELARAGVPLTLITDNMAAHFMRRGGITAVFVGADRIAANGDVANKIGTYGLGVLAHAHSIPLYVVAPRSTIDLSLPSGDAIPIEERGANEVTSVLGTRIAPVGVKVANPAFDVTPSRYVAAIITEAGIIRPPFEVGLLEEL